ncbi:hypothetical protein D3C78_1602680 [compost metagenome]
MHDAVQPSHSLLDLERQGIEFVVAGLEQVQRNRQRLRQAGRHDLVVHLFQALHAARQQYHGGAMARGSQRRLAADALRGPVHQHHAAGEIIFVKRLHHVLFSSPA